MKYKYKKIAVIVFILIIGLITSCSDYLNPSLEQNKPISSIKTADDLNGLVIGAYNSLNSINLYGRAYVIIGDSRTSNAFSNGNSGRFIEQSMFEVTEAGSGGIWDDAYSVIRNCNMVINSKIKGDRADKLKGEAYALRALSHIILLKVYGEQFVDGSNLGIPYVTTFNDREKFSPSRLTVKQSETKIEADYKKALDLLKPSNHDDVYRLNYYSTEALLSRFYLFIGDYEDAAVAAKDVIDSKVYELVSASGYVVAWDNNGAPAALFEVAFSTSDNLNRNSLFYMLQGGYGDVEVTKELYQLFDGNDVRKKLYGMNITDYDKSLDRNVYRVTGKYTSLSSNVPVIRYAEVILNYAEAEARLGNTGKAKKYLDKITSHRNVGNYQKATVTNILLERRKEFAMEGLYYWQLLRTGKGIHRNLKRSSISYVNITVPMGDYRLAYPIPTGELDANSNIKQNKGYGGR